MLRTAITTSAPTGRVHRPTTLLRNLLQVRIRVHAERPLRQLQHRLIVHGVADHNFHRLANDFSNRDGLQFVGRHADESVAGRRRCRCVRRPRVCARVEYRSARLPPRPPNRWSTKPPIARNPVRSSGASTPAVRGKLDARRPRRRTPPRRAATFHVRHRDSLSPSRRRSALR